MLIWSNFVQSISQNCWDQHISMTVKTNPFHIRILIKKTNIWTVTDGQTWTEKVEKIKVECPCILLPVSWIHFLCTHCVSRVYCSRCRMCFQPVTWWKRMYVSNVPFYSVTTMFANSIKTTSAIGYLYFRTEHFAASFDHFPHVEAHGKVIPPVWTWSTLSNWVYLWRLLCLLTILSIDLCITS